MSLLWVMLKNECDLGVPRCMYCDCVQMAIAVCICITLMIGRHFHQKSQSRNMYVASIGESCPPFSPPPPMLPASAFGLHTEEVRIGKIENSSTAESRRVAALS